MDRCRWAIRSDHITVVRSKYIIGGGGGSAPLITLYKRPTKPAQTTSYSSYDEGWQLANGVFDNYNNTTATGVQTQTQDIDFATDSTGNTLLYNNPFGNTDRWTDENGLQVYGNDIAIDNLTGFRWRRNIADATYSMTSKTWATLLSDCNNYTDPLGNSDYFMPTLFEIMTLAVIDLNQSSIQYTSALTPNTVSGNHYFMSSTTGTNFLTHFYRVTHRNRSQQQFDSKTTFEFRNYACMMAILPQPTTPNP